MNGVRQDRLVKTLRLAGISDLATTNAYLARIYLPAHNRQFQKPPDSPADMYRAVPRVGSAWRRGNNTATGHF